MQGQKAGVEVPEKGGFTAGGNEATGRTAVGVETAVQRVPQWAAAR